MDEEGEEIEGVPAFFQRHPLLFCFLLFLTFTYAFVYPVFAFIVASAPVLVLTAFLLGLVLLNSMPRDHDPHLYKKISHRPPQYQPTTAAIGPRPNDESPPTSDSSSSSSADDDNYNRPTMSTATSHASFPDTTANSESDSTDSDHEEKHQNHQRSEKKEAVRAVAWTADDDKSIENIGSLELEMNATVEKLMSRRRARGHQRPLHHHHHHVMDLVDIDDPSKLSITTRKSNPFDLDGPYDEDDNFPDSAPSMLGLRPSRNPFFDDMDDNLHLQAPPQSSSIPGAGAAQKNAMMFRRHESFTVGAPYVSDFRPSRFRPYFITEKMQGQPVTVPEASRKSSSSSTSSSSAGATAYAYAYTSANKEEEAAAEQEEALAEAAMLEEVKSEEYSSRSREVVAVDVVELISDSSDDDMTLPGGHAGKHHQVQVAEQAQQMKMEQQQQVADEEQRMKLQAAEQEQRMKLQQLAEHEQRLKQQQQQQLAEQEQRLKLQQQHQLAEQEQQQQQQQQQLAEQEQRLKLQQQHQLAEQEQQQQQQQLAEQEQRLKLQQQHQLAEQEQQQQQQQLAEQEQRLKLQQQHQLAEQEQQQQQHQLALSDDEDDEGDSFEVESITKQVAAAAAGKTKQLEADPAYDYSPSASAPPGKTEKRQQEAAAFAPLPPVAPNKLQSMRRVFSEEDADEPWAAPSALEETTGAMGNEAFPLPPLPESAPSAAAAGGAPPLSAAAKKAIGKSTKYKPPTKKAVLGFFRK